MVRKAILAAAATIAIMTAIGITAAAAAPGSAGSTCSVAPGETVMLRSSDFDPDVLVWDSRQRAIAYAGGLVKSADELLAHTVVSSPGTKALVLACDPGSSRPKYATSAQDTVGLRLTSGPHKGHYGWVASGDIRDPRSMQGP